MRAAGRIHLQSRTRPSLPGDQECQQNIRATATAQARTGRGAAKIPAAGLRSKRRRSDRRTRRCRPAPGFRAEDRGLADLRLRPISALPATPRCRTTGWTKTAISDPASSIYLVDSGGNIRLATTISPARVLVVPGDPRRRCATAFTRRVEGPHPDRPRVCFPQGHLRRPSRRAWRGNIYGKGSITPMARSLCRQFLSVHGGRAGHRQRCRAGGPRRN